MLAAAAADGLTLLRALLSPLIAILVAVGRLDLAAVALGAAWLTDAFDGRLARGAEVPTRLGEWDMPVDVALGASLLIGLGLGGWLPAWLAAAGLLVLGGGYLLLQQVALGMALQGLAYGAFLWRLLAEDSPVRWFPFAVALGIGVLERRRLIHEELPVFFRGIAHAVRLRKGDGLGLPE